MSGNDPKRVGQLHPRERSFTLGQSCDGWPFRTTRSLTYASVFLIIDPRPSPPTFANTRGVRLKV